MKNSARLIAQYREALAGGAALASADERKLYALHTKELEHLLELLSSGAPYADIAKLIATERRAFGWSFLAGPHGERVERAFHALAAVLETQCC